MPVLSIRAEFEFRSNHVRFELLSRIRKMDQIKPSSSVVRQYHTLFCITESYGFSVALARIDMLVLKTVDSHDRNRHDPR